MNGNSDLFDGQPVQEEVTTLLQQLATKATSLDLTNSKLRKDLLATARSLYHALETPMESSLRMEWAQLSLNAAVRTCIDLKLFETENAKSSAVLAKLTNSDPILLSRILKHLAAMEFIKEIDVDKYCHSRLSKSMLDPLFRHSVVFCFDIMGPTFLAAPAQLSHIKYINPTNPLKNSFQRGHQTPLHVFAFLQANPEHFEHFSHHMGGYSASRARWMDVGCVDVLKVLGTKSSKDEDVLLVDIGGGVGHDLLEFHAKHPDAKGKFVLQELAEVVNSVKNLPGCMEVMVHDFFTPQPVIGAKPYYLHSILHDWPKDKCIEILLNLIPALKKGHSKILITENIVPGKGAHWEITALDMVMMTHFAATERTEEAWREMLEGVGLKVVKI